MHAQPTARPQLAADLPLECHTAGDRGPRVLLLHGIPGSALTFERVAAELSSRCRVVAPSLLGFGASPPGPPGTHARQQADAVARLLAELGGDEPWHVVGFDFGGPTAVHLAGSHPARVASLTVLAANLFPDTPVPGPLRLATVPVLGPLFFRLAFGKLGLLAMWRAAVGDAAAFPLARYRAALTAQGVASTRRVFFESLRDLPGLYAPVERIAQGLTVPAQVLWGTRDPFFPVDVGRRTAAVLRARLQLLDGCGHFVPEERPREVAAAIWAQASDEPRPRLAQ